MADQSPPRATSSQLRRWRMRILARDGRWLDDHHGTSYGMPGCIMCRARLPASRVQVHHIRPKSLYPHLALDLANGIALCGSCHIGIVHGGNTAVDVYHNSRAGREGWWRFYVASFDRYNSLAAVRRYNQQHSN